MTRLSDFEGAGISLPVEPLRMPIVLRVIPLEGVDVVELPPDSGWEHFEFEDTVPAGLVP